MVHDLSDRSEVVFDDERVVVNAGIVLAVTLGRRLGIEALVDAAVGSAAGRGRRGRGARCSRSFTRCCSAPTPSMTATCCAPGGPRPSSVTGRWRPRRSARSCARSPSGMSASSTACSARRCGALGRRAPARRRAAGHRHRLLHRRGPRRRQAGRRLRLHRRLGYHPLLATRADTSEVLHVRLARAGQHPARRAALRRRAARASPSRRRGGQILFRADSGFWKRRSPRACASRAAATRSASRCTRSSPRGSR